LIESEYIAKRGLPSLISSQLTPPKLRVKSLNLSIVSMLVQVLYGLAATALWQGQVSASPSKGASLESFIKKEADISIKGVLANIGSDGKRAQGAAPGAVVASPSREDPDCKPTSYRLLNHTLTKSGRLVYLDS
jgi:hypothetical protein